MTGDLSTIYRKIGATKANIIFLTKCRKCNLIPKGFLSKKRIFFSPKMSHQFAKIRMREMLNSLHAKLFLLELDTKTAHIKEKDRMDPQLSRKTQDREYFRRMKILNKKLTKMLSLQKNKTNINLVHNAVINLSSKGLSQDETNVLARGFKFRPTLKELPIREIIIATETLIKTASIPPSTAAHLRNATLTETEK